MKIRSSTKFVLTTVLVGVAIWGAMEGWSDMQTKGVDLRSLEAGKVNLIVVDPKVGYHVKVTNAVANLYPGKPESFESPGQATEAGGRRLPIIELVASLQGDVKALGTFIEAVNKMNQGDEPLSTKEWQAADLAKALNGDPELKRRLEADLNVGLDGVPIRAASYFALNNGITVLVPVTVRVPEHKHLAELTATVRVPYRPKFCKDVMAVLEQRFNPTDQEIVGVYGEKARPFWAYQAELAKYGGSLSGQSEKVIEEFNKLVATGKIAPPVDIKSFLSSIISDSGSAMIGETAEKILGGINVLVNESEISGCRVVAEEDGSGKTMYDIRLGLKDAGRRRLWKFSREAKDFVLLVVVDGVAIAAPHIGTQLASSEVTISNLRDKRLTESAAEKIKKFAQSGDKT